MPGRVNILSAIPIGAEAGVLLDANNSRRLAAALRAADKLLCPQDRR